MVAGVVLVPIRIAVFAVGLGVGYLFARLSILGLSRDELTQSPLSRARRLLLTPIPYVCGFV